MKINFGGAIFLYKVILITSTLVCVLALIGRALIVNNVKEVEC